MTKNSRTKSVIKNSVFGIIGQLFNLIINFASRTIFIQLLGAMYLGIHGLFSNIFSILSLFELGIGSAIVYSLYKPLAEKNERKIEALMNLYAKAYKVIGLGILIIGLSILPLLKFIVTDQSNIPQFKLIFILFLTSSAVSYFFAYKRSIFLADQKNYINIINNNIFSLLTKIGQIIVLLLTKDFILYLLVQIIFTFLSNLEISIRANKIYPYLKKSTGAKLTREDMKDIKKNVSAMFLLKIGDVVINGTNNLIISSFIGLVWVGIYSNYVMLINIVQTFIGHIFTSLSASVGNLVSLENKEKALEIFNKIYFINFIIFGFSSICLFNLLNPFITLWIGKEYLLSTGVVFLIILNMYLMGIRNVLWVYINSLGLYFHFRYMPFIECTINLGVSIFLINKIGIAGVFLGTIISTLATYFFAEPYIIYKYYFKIPLYKYFIKYFTYLGMIFVIGLINLYVTSVIVVSNWLGLILKMGVNVSLICFLFSIVFYKTKEFRYFANIVFNYVKKFKKSRSTMSNTSL
ncbi:lipopolysaccharide biosynthesis protein [Bacillus sp. MB2021]|uniref:lipopolysaccharide biosynthesis protein n=1 Tax=Bacillus sp. MB2021 TaxID=1408303 RepID=UPI00054E6880|nr:hypothetical protein [Bacillus sp. MB2021]